MSETKDIVYDDNTDIFYNDQYMDVVKDYDYVLELKPIRTKNVVIGQKSTKSHAYRLLSYSDSYAHHAKKDTDESDADKRKALLAQIANVDKISKVIALAHIKRNLSFWRYMVLDHTMFKSVMAITFNQLIKKYARVKVYGNNILIMRYGILEKTYDIIESVGTLFDNYAYFLFHRCKKCNIYAVFNHDAKQEYAPSVTNAKNGNTYYLVNHDNTGDIMDADIFKTIVDRLKDVRFDITIIRPVYAISHVSNIIVLYTHILTLTSKENARMVCQIDTFADTSPWFNMMIPLYEKSTLVQSKFLGKSFHFVFLVCNKYHDYVSHNVRINALINDVFLNELVITNDEADFTYVHYFIEKLLRKHLERITLTHKLMKYMSDVLYETLAPIIHMHLKTYQRGVVRQKRFAKYYLPY